MRDPLEGLSESGTIRTGADMRNVAEAFRPVHQAASATIHERDISASVYAYGSVVTGQAQVGVSDVDLLTIGLPPSDANLIGAELSTRFANVCRASRSVPPKGATSSARETSRTGTECSFATTAFCSQDPTLTVRSTISLGTVALPAVSTATSPNTSNDGETLSRQTRTQDSSHSGWRASHCWRLLDWSASMTTPGQRTGRRAPIAGAKSSQHITTGSPN